MSESVPKSPSNAQVLLIYPPTPEPTFHCLFTTTALITLLTLSICGNFSQLALQYYSRRLRVGNSDSSPNCTQLYIGILYIIQFFFALSLPSVIVDHLVQIWMFGMITCASHFVLINVGRTASAWLIVLLFYDQAVINGSPKPSENKQRKIFFHSALFVIALCAISIFPVFKYIKLVEEVIQEDYAKDVVIHIRTFKCLTTFGRGSQRLLINATAFFIDYVAPLAMITVLSLHLFWYSKTHRVQAKVLTRKMQNIRLTIAVLFFACHAPHWMAVGCVILSDYLDFNPAGWQTQFLGDAALFGPYLMPAFMWIPLSALSTAAQTQTKFYNTSASTLTAPCMSNLYTGIHITAVNNTPSDSSNSSLLKQESRERTVSLGQLHKGKNVQPLKYVRMQSLTTMKSIRQQNTYSQSKNVYPVKNTTNGNKLHHLTRMLTVDVSNI
ncbi:unnamed protein product [Bursaphelenchus okinawaensis]|uniref:G-protein coupled receptors family 1 profile domain-containing protein n=1 Tax=Bursaphelenchus okinawaensis TaxID=465554 RepID=A0A811KX69_9BILA|nr:unnamed protein product [Bursaphelenchus okinawaensis]CAG9113681.1 unnamed protein product [Bursaphelenchus okinawaensis]